MNNDKIKKLIMVAKQNRESAFVPESKHKVGAAVLTESGAIFGGCNIDEDSKVNRNPGYQATNLNVHQELPTLPVNLPRVRGYYNADTESNLRCEPTFNKKQCTATSEKSFNPYTFEIFDHLCYNPQDPEYIIPEDSFNKCFPNARFYTRPGEDTRHDRQSRYRNGCDWKIKHFPSNLSYSNFGY